MLREASIAASLMVVGVPSGLAQICLGSASLANAHVQVFGAGSLQEGSRNAGGGLIVGSGGPFVLGYAGTTMINDAEASSFNIGGTVGWQIPTDKKGAAQICPIAGVFHSHFPGIFDADIGDYVILNELDLSAGIAAGFSFPQTSSRVHAVPEASLEVVSGTVKVGVSQSSLSVSGTQTYGILSLGFGLVVDQRATIRPAISIPLGLDNSSVSLGVAVGVIFGRSSPRTATEVTDSASALGGWRDRQNWRALERGLSKPIVRRLLGEPGSITVLTSGGEIWFYPNAQGGSVSFDENEKLNGWKEP